METFLLHNGYRVSGTVDEQEALILSLASGSLTREDLLQRLEAHILPANPPD